MNPKTDQYLEELKTFMPELYLEHPAMKKHSQMLVSSKLWEQEEALIFLAAMLFGPIGTVVGALVILIGSA